MSKKVQAAAKLREAMSELQVAMKKATPAEKKLIATSMTEVRALYKSVTAADEPTAAPAVVEDELSLEEALIEELDLPTSTLEELGFDGGDEDAVLAGAALDLAAKALANTSANSSKISDEQIARMALSIAAAALNAAEGDEEPVDEPADDTAEEDEDPDAEALLDDAPDDMPMDDMGMEDDGMDDGMGEDDLPLSEFDDPSADDASLDEADDLPSPDVLLEDMTPLPESSLPGSDFDVPSASDEPMEDASDEGFLTENDLMSLAEEGLLTPEMLDILEEAIDEKEEGHPVTDVSTEMLDDDLPAPDEAAEETAEIDDMSMVDEEFAADDMEAEDDAEDTGDAEEEELPEEEEDVVEARLKAAADNLRAMIARTQKKAKVEASKPAAKPVAKPAAKPSGKKTTATTSKVSAAGAYAVVDFSENPRVGYITSLHKDSDSAHEACANRPTCMVQHTDRGIGDSVKMDEMDEQNNDLNASVVIVAFDEVEADEFVTVSEYAEIMASLTPEERKEILTPTVSAAKMSPAALKKMERNEVRNRKIRKKRGPVLKSKTGKKASITLPGGKRKTIKKKFYFTTFDSKGNKLGQHWMATKRPRKETIDQYKNKNGVPHPYALPIDPKAAKAAREQMKKKKG